MNTNKEIISLKSGELDPQKPGVDLLFVGSNTNVLVYDCVKNSDVFDKELDEGLTAVAMAEPGTW